MKKNYLFLATAAAVMAGCANEDFIGDSNISNGGNGDNAIGFNMQTPAMTRALEDKNAADKLGNMFFVWGEKNESKTTSNDSYAATAANTVFQNYTVKYGENTANTTTSNTQDWEYVGLNDAVSNANLTPQAPTSQTIKYWDANATDYTFTAVSAKPSDITDTNNKVVIKKITKAPENGSALDKGYEITIKDLNAAADVYVSDRVNITKKDLATGNPENAYGGFVKFTFRKFQSKVRFGIYEKVPGYKVVITGLKYTTKAAAGESQATVETHTSTDTDKTFGVTGDFVAAGENTKYTVTYETASADNNGLTVNRAKFNVGNSTKQTYFTSGTEGTNWLSTEFKGVNDSGNKTVGEEANAPTWDKGDATDGSKSWTPILPNPQNTTPLTLEISYDLYSEDTGEKISVDYKKVNVPYEYCQWKPNFAYTYLFKITDKSADLYPITFDACVVEDETGKQETITTVSEPSITTFATTSDGKSYKTGSNEYVASDVIYATVLESGKVVKLTRDDSNNSITGNVKLYTVTTSDATNFPITEASVANAITNNSVANKKITATAVSLTDNNIVTQVPTEDGNKITLSNNGTALTWSAENAKVYAVEYTNNNVKTYKIVRINGATGQSN